MEFRLTAPDVDYDAAEYEFRQALQSLRTTAGDMPSRWVIHAATMVDPGGTTSAEVIEQATRATLECAEQLRAESLALVAFGTGVGGFPLDEAARIMVGEVRAFETRSLERIVFAVHGDEAERAFGAAAAQTA